MLNDSGIFENKDLKIENKISDYDFILLRATALSKLWRMSHDGKYFLVKTTLDNSEYQLKMLRREYEMSIGCDNPHIVHVFTYEHDIHGGDGIVMEYIEGRTLREYLEEKPSLSSRQRIFQELLTAVNYMHKRGVLHNDLKPENILITRADDTLKIIDFGLADKDAFFAWKTLGCSPKYASPELKNQSKDIDVRSDIYSIGTIMREIFKGRYSRIVKRCCKENPKHRYSDVAELQKVWHGRNRIWKWLMVFCVLVAIASPTFLYVDLKMEEDRNNNYRENLIESIKKDVSQIFEPAIDTIAKIEDKDEQFQYIRNVCFEYEKYFNEKIYEIQDPEQRSIIIDEISVLAKGYIEKINY